MPKQRKQSHLTKSKRKTFRRRRFNRSNLKGVNVESHLVYTNDLLTRTPGMISHAFSISELCSQYKNTYGECYVTRVVATFRPRCATTTVGLYAMMITDGADDYGTFTWSANWYRVIACYPGSTVKRRTQNCTKVWYPSEAEDKNYFAAGVKHTVFNLVIVNDSLDNATEQIAGEIELRVRIRARTSVKQNFTQHLKRLKPDDMSGFEVMNM